MLQLSNETSLPFHGWLTGSVANAPAGTQHGRVNGMPLVLSHQLGLRGHLAHLLADLPAGSVLQGDIEWGGAPPPPLPPMPGNGDPVALVAALGVPSVNGLALVYRGIIPSAGGPIGVLFRSRFSRMLIAELSLFFTPGQDFAEFELDLTCSNPAVQDLVEVLERDVLLTCGRALVQFTSGAEYTRAMPAGESFGDAQRRCFFGVITWAHLAEFDELRSSIALVTGAVGFYDLEWDRRIGLLDAPALPPRQWNANSWVRHYFTEAKDNIRTWLPNRLGIAAASGSSGEQEDQGFGGKGTAAFTGGGFGAVQLLRMVAMGWGKQPMHYHELDTFPLRLDHNAALWSGRITDWSPDTLGKLRRPDESETHHWSGPDNQHFLMHTLGCAYQLTGRPQLQRLIHQRGILFHYSQTLRPDWATSMPDAARAWGWMGEVASWLWRTLEDRDLANRVRERFIERVRIYQQATGGRDIWDVRPNDFDSAGNMIGVGREIWSDSTTTSPFPSFWFTYQQAQAVGGLQIAGEVMDIPEARALALSGARSVVARAYQESGLEWESLGITPEGEPLPPEAFVEGRGAHRTDDFVTAWLPLAPWVVLRHEPDNARARFLYERAKEIALAHVPPFGHPEHPCEWIAPL